MKYAQIFLATTLLTGIASAETAGEAMKRGQTAYKAGRIHEACDAFAASDKLAASSETEWSLAGCYEQDGKPVAAAKLYRAVAAQDPKRKDIASAKATKLEARAPKLRFAIAATPGLVVKVDGVEVVATEDVMVDTGPHEVIATAPGFEGHASAPVDREKAIVDVIIRLQPVEAPPAPAATVPPPAQAAAAASEPSAPRAAAPMAMHAESAEPASTDHRMRNGIIVGAVGVGALVTAGVLFVAGTHKFDDEHALCPSSRCATTDDLEHANSLLDDGHLLRGLSIGTGIAGLALVGVGGYLVATHKTEESHVMVQLDHRGGSIGYTARF
ncbi:MAG: hypothetical protein ABI678_13150 [Kofleriaceae bacterium]